MVAGESERNHTSTAAGAEGESEGWKQSIFLRAGGDPLGSRARSCVAWVGGRGGGGEEMQFCSLQGFRNTVLQ